MTYALLCILRVQFAARISEQNLRLPVAEILLGPPRGDLHAQLSSTLSRALPPPLIGLVTDYAQPFTALWASCFGRGLDILRMLAWTTANFSRSLPSFTVTCAMPKRW